MLPNLCIPMNSLSLNILLSFERIQWCTYVASVFKKISQCQGNCLLSFQIRALTLLNSVIFSSQDCSLLDRISDSREVVLSCLSSANIFMFGNFDAVSASWAKSTLKLLLSFLVLLSTSRFFS